MQVNVNDVETALIRKFAPQVYLYSKDFYRPSSVPWILQYAVLESPYKEWDKFRSTLLLQGQVTPTTLVSQSYEVKPGTVQSSGYTYNSKNLNPPVTGFALYYPGQGDPGNLADVSHTPPPGSPLYGQPLQRNPDNSEQWLCTAPCYAHCRMLNAAFASYAITYCFFYPFNGSSSLYGAASFGIHIADWERVTVYISPDQTKVACVFFAAHSGGTWAFPGQFELVQDEVGSKTHVVVFSGSGGHPSYSTPGEHTNQPLSPDYTDQGPSWPTWKTVVDVGDIYDAAGPTQGNEWLKYSGRWGTTNSLSADCPPTPSFQGWWHGEAGEQTLLGSNGAFQTFLLHTGTPIEAADGANNFAYWGLADYNGDGIPDLFGVKVRNTGSGKVEVHVLDGAKNYQSFLLQTPTAINADDGAADFLWSIANTGSPKPPLYGIKINHSATNTAEVHVLDGAKNYQSFLFEHGTAISASDAAQKFAAWNVSYTTGSKWLSLFCVKVRNTGTRMVEIHILDGSNEFEKFLYEHGTLISQTDGAINYSAWAVADYQRNGYFDLFGIKVRNTVTGKVEVVVLDGHNELESFLLQAATPIDAADGANNFGGWATADYNKDGIPDLFAIKVRNTGTNMVEVHVLNGAPKPK